MAYARGKRGVQPDTSLDAFLNEIHLGTYRQFLITCPY